MRLYIDTSNTEKIVVSIGEKIYSTQSRLEKSQKLLSFIDEILRRQGFGLNNLTEIEINPGPGSYTGLRVGMSVANALSWVLNIPVNGKKVTQGEFEEIIYK